MEAAILSYVLIQYRLYYHYVAVQFQRREVVSKIFTLILKGNVNLRKGKMALLPHRQGINTIQV
jgi:hypothetical protein